MQKIVKRLLWIVIPVVCLVGIYLMALLHSFMGDEAALRNGAYSDFYVFWGAAKLGLAGAWQTAFDTEALHQWHPLPEVSVAARYTGWLYPPAIQVLMAPLGFADVATAWLIFSVLSIVVYALGARLLAGRFTTAFALALVAPATWIALIVGNNSLLTAGVAAVAVGLLAVPRAVLAGIMIGALCIKPQVGLLFPFALAAGGYWRCFIAAVVAAVAVTVGTSLIVGVDYWFVLSERLEWAGSVAGPGSRYFVDLVSYYGFARGIGLAHGPAMQVQIIATVLFGLLTVFVWWRPGPFRLKAAILLLCIPLASPHSFRYELTFVTLGVLSVASIERLAFWEGHAGRVTLGLLTLLYLCPLVPLAASKGVLTLFGVAIPTGTIMVPLFTAAILWLLWQQMRMAKAAE
ncbi:MAG: glycosyltransferase family 87 protein [Pseudomonadota bacterium]